MAGMHLRSGTVVGTLPGAPAEELRPLFEEGIGIIMQTWTGLALAVTNEWGGASSRQKADQLRADIVEWFYRGKQHWADELEEAIDEVMKGDFNVELEDGSPMEVAEAMVALHAEMMQGGTGRLVALREKRDAMARSGVVPGMGSTAQVVDNDGAVMDGSDSSDEDESMGDDGSMGEERLPPPGPVIDDDGFELVQKKGGRRR